jgi:hypothetical protein
MRTPPLKPRVLGRACYPTATLQFHGLVRNAQARLTLHALTYPAAGRTGRPAHRPSTSAGLPCSRPTLQALPRPLLHTGRLPCRRPTLQTPPTSAPPRRSRLARPSPDLPTYPTGPSPRTRRPPCLGVPPAYPGVPAYPAVPTLQSLPAVSCLACGAPYPAAPTLQPAGRTAAGCPAASGPVVPGGTPYSAPPTTTPPPRAATPPKTGSADLPYTPPMTATRDRAGSTSVPPPRPQRPLRPRRQYISTTAAAPATTPLTQPAPRRAVKSEKSRRRRAYPQQIVTTRLLYCLQDPFAQLSRLQRI